MRTPFFAHRSVQNKSWRFRGSVSIFACKNVQKNRVFWGIRKCVKNIIWTNKNSKFFVILITQKFHCVGWVNPVWGYIIFITSNRNYHKKCDSFCTFGNSLHGFFSRILGGLGGSHGSSTLYWTDRIVFSACFTSSEIYFVHFSVCFFWGRFLDSIFHRFFEHRFFGLISCVKIRLFSRSRCINAPVIPNLWCSELPSQNLCRSRSPLVIPV